MIAKIRILMLSLIATAALLSSTDAFAQDKPLRADELYSSVNYFSAYPGGVAGLVKFLSENIQYPEAAQKAQIEGTVLLQFIVEKDGSVGDVTVLRSVDPDLDAEAVRVCKLLSQFKPARNAETDEPVRVMYTLPVAFKLE